MRTCETCSRFDRLKHRPEYGHCTLGGKMPQSQRQFSVTVKANGFCAEHSTSVLAGVKSLIDYFKTWGKNGKATN